MAFQDYSTDPDENTELEGPIYIGPNMERNKVRRAFQRLASDGRALYDNINTMFAAKTKGDPGDISPFATRTLLAAQTSVSGHTSFLGESGREGEFVFSTANNTANVTADTRQAIYVPPSTDTTGASGAWVRKFTGAKDARWFGAVGDGVTDDYTALQAWLDSGGDLYLPAGEFYCSQRLQVRKMVRLHGAGYGFDARIASYQAMPGSRIRFPAGQGGIIAWTQTTHDDTSDVAASPGTWFTQEGAQYSTFKDLALIGPATGAAVTGFETRTRVNLINVQCIKFNGKGFDIQGSADIDDVTSDYGNTSLTTLKACRAAENGSHGFHIRGRDASLVKVDSCDAINNGGWGFWDQSIFGGAFSNCHAAANTSGSYKATQIVGCIVFENCYVEGGVGAGCDIAANHFISGGTLSGTTNAASGGGLPTAVNGLNLKWNVAKLNPNNLQPGALTSGAAVLCHATHGLWLQGFGATYDFCLRNRNDADVMKVPAATQNVEFSGTVSGVDDAYDATTWNANLAFPTKNAVRDKIETLASAPVVKTLTADYTNSTTTQATATDGSVSLSAPVVNGGTYEFIFYGKHQTAATTTGVLVAVNPAGSGATGNLTGSVHVAITQGSASTEVAAELTALGGAGSGIVSPSVSAINTNHYCKLGGVLVCTASGTLDIQFASEVAASAAKLMAGSTLIVRRIV